jgi:hypothetical protein
MDKRLAGAELGTSRDYAESVCPRSPRKSLGRLVTFLIAGAIAISTWFIECLRTQGSLFGYRL